VAPDEQIRQNDLHGGVSGLGRNMQRIGQIAQTTAWLVIANQE
jgi:hypothetical protein